MLLQKDKCRHGDSVRRRQPGERKHDDQGRGFRRLWHALRYPVGGRGHRSGLPGIWRAHHPDLAHQTARIHLAAIADAALPGFFGDHARIAGLHPRLSRAGARRRDFRCDHGQICPSRSLSRRLAGAFGIEGPQARHSLQRQHRHAQRAGPQYRARPCAGCNHQHRLQRAVQAEPGRLHADRVDARRSACRRAVRLVQSIRCLRRQGLWPARWISSGWSRTIASARCRICQSSLQAWQ